MRVGADQDVELTDPLEGDPRLPDVFGPAWSSVQRFHQLLVEEGPVRGLIGPRETARLWERHLLNSGAAAAQLGGAATLIDLGSGAGLPGVVVAAMAPAVRVTLLEPMARRVAWLDHVVTELGLSNVEVVRGRAEEVAGRLRADALTARAVAPLEKLYGWAAPLVVPGGVLLALKGTRASEEIAAARESGVRFGWVDSVVVTSSMLDGAEPTTIVRAVRAAGARRVR